MFYEQWLTYVKEFGAEILGLYALQDYIEVLLFITITYKALFWLKQDHTKHLLLTSYAYFSVLSLTYLTSCTILFTTMLVLAPAFIIFCIVIHQKQLQKNFVTPSKKYFTPSTTPQKNWLESLVQSCLIASHHKKNLTCIIERNNAITPLLDVPFTLQFPIQQEITNFILASEHLDQNALMWTHQSGVIHSINAHWSSFLTNEILVKPKDTMALHHEAALLLTEKTDAIIFAINTTSDMHTIWYQGKCIQQVSVQQLLNFIKKIFNEPSDKTSINTKSTHNKPVNNQSVPLKGEQNDQKHNSAS